MSKPTTAVPAKLSTLLRPAVINLNVRATDKTGALREVAELLRAGNGVADFDTFFAEILERERISNTALAQDVAIPHARTEQCGEILVAVGRSTAGVDFEAREHQPVHLIFLIGTPKAMVTDYLRVVGNLARLIRQDSLRQKLLEAPDAASFIKVIEAAEA